MSDATPDSPARAPRPVKPVASGGALIAPVVLLVVLGVMTAFLGVNQLVTAR